MQALAEKHTITLVSFVRSEQDVQSAGALKQFCDQIETVLLPRSMLRDVTAFGLSLLRGKTFIVIRDHQPEMEATVQRLLSSGRYDIVHLDHLQMAQFVPQDTPIVKVLDEHNVEWRIIRRVSLSDSSIVKRLLAALEYPRLRQFEKEACCNADYVLTVTNEDASALKKLIGNSGSKQQRPRIETISIGVDTDYFGYSWRHHTEPRIVFVGTMYWPPNVDSVIHFCNDILPIARSEIPELRFDIVGLRPTRSVLNLQSTVSGVHVIGSVPDVRPYMAASRVFVVPLRAGSGMRVKILNAMAVGIPVVTTSIGCEGIDGLVQVKEPLSDYDNSDANIWVANSPHEFARAVVTLITNDGIARTLSRNGRALMETAYEWSIIRNRILDLYDRIEQELTRKSPDTTAS